MLNHIYICIYIKQNLNIVMYIMSSCIMMFNLLIKICVLSYFRYLSCTVFVFLVYIYCLKYRFMYICLLFWLVAVILIVVLYNFFGVIVEFRCSSVVGRAPFLLSFCFPSGAGALLGNQLLLYSIMFVLRFRDSVSPYI